MAIHSMVIALSALPGQTSLPAGIAPSLPHAPAPADTARFDSLLQGAAPVSAPQAVSAATGPVNLGDNILHAMERVRTGLKADEESVRALLGPQRAAPTSIELVEAQYKLANIGFVYDLCSKVVGKTVQNVEQLVKMQ